RRPGRSPASRRLLTRAVGRGDPRAAGAARGRRRRGRLLRHVPADRHGADPTGARHDEVRRAPMIGGAVLAVWFDVGPGGGRRGPGALPPPRPAPGPSPPPAPAPAGAPPGRAAARFSPRFRGPGPGASPGPPRPAGFGPPPPPGPAARCQRSAG